VLTAGRDRAHRARTYGLDWKVIERDDDDYIRFAVPEKQPTGNGVWQANVGLSMVKTADPAILFANLGYVHSFPRSFDDIEPRTRSTRRREAGRLGILRAGVAFAFNERTSSACPSATASAPAPHPLQGRPWMKVIGSDANAASLNLGVTYALDQHTTLVTMLGIGLTPDAPDFSLTFRCPTCCDGRAAAIAACRPASCCRSASGDGDERSAQLVQHQVVLLAQAVDGDARQAQAARIR
jgi:hypothetical protein